MSPGIYVHLPFCKVQCVYCDFPLTTRTSLQERFYKALLREISLNRPAESADTLYFGGGTPSLTPHQMLAQIRNQFELMANAEITLEANPDDINVDSLDRWRALGISRLSIGVQSLQAAALQWMLRQHSAQQSVAAIQQAQLRGYNNISVDLILGSPGQTEEGFADGLHALVELRPQHVSLYFLESHEGTAYDLQLQGGAIQPMEEEEQVRSYLRALEILETAGYCHYEVSNFALPGFESRHNLKYWSDEPYYAYGPGACSYVGTGRVQNVRSVERYIDMLELGRLPIHNRIWEDSDTARRNALIFGLRKRQGVDVVEFKRKFGVSPMSLFHTPVVEYMKEELLVLDGRHLKLTVPGLLVSNEILSSII